MSNDKRKIAKTRAAVRRSTEDLQASTASIELALVRFQSGDHEITFNLDLTAETVWATQHQIADLFGVDRSAIVKHLQNIFAEGELSENSVCAKMAQTATDGKTYQVLHYNLDAILSVGYRVSSAKATKFRQWASSTLKSYIVDGFVLNEARLQNDPASLKKLAAKVRELRSSEKSMFAAVRDVFKIASIDYDVGSSRARSFYAKLTDKFHYAVTQRTAAQTILDRADHKKDNMGLVTMAGDRPTKQDVTVGKNYLEGDELSVLQMLCEQFLLFAESKAMRGQPLTMAEMSNKLDRLLEANDYPVFLGYDGGYLKPKALQHAERELILYERRLFQEQGISPRRLIERPVANDKSPPTLFSLPDAAASRR